MLYPFLKRTFDLFGVIVGGVFISPLIVGLIVLQWVLMGRPLFFRQKRPGREERIFEIIKFRTMTLSRDSAGELLPDEQRMTRWGTFLRKTSLDELPELWNVLKGEMSLVGPRPLLPEYLERYNARQKRRHNVRPGITGWSQVNGRNNISWFKKLEQDVWYVENASFLLDLRILLWTAFKVLLRRDISHEEHATSPPFEGGGDIS